VIPVLAYKSKAKNPWSHAIALPLLLSTGLVIVLASGATEASMVIAFVLVLGTLLLAVPWKPGQMLALISFPLVGASVYMAFSNDDTSFLSIGTLSLMIGMTALLKHSDRSLETFSPFWFTLVGFLLVCCVPGIWYLANGDVPTWALAQALWFATLGFLMFLIGYHLQLGKILGTRLPPPADRLPGARLRLAFIGMAILGTACFWILMNRSGFNTYGELIANMMEFRIRSSSMGFAYLLLAVGIAFHIAAVLLFFQVLRGPKIRLFPALRFAAFVLYAYAIFLPFALRGMFLGLGAGLAIVFNFLKRPIRKREFLLAGLLAVVFIAGFGRYRDPNTQWRSVRDVIDDLNEFDFLKITIGQFDAIENFALFLQQYHAKPIPSDPSAFFIAILTRPIPRSLMPSKVLDTSSQLTSLVLPDVHAQNVNFGFTVFAELYFYFSTFGIILGMLMYGIMIQVLQTYYERYTNREGFLLYYSLIFSFPIGFLGGGFDSSGTITFAISTAMSWAVLWYMSGGILRGPVSATTRKNASLLGALRRSL
jgi:hypothetical protein